MRLLLIALLALALPAQAAATLDAQRALLASIPDGNAKTFRAFIGDTELGTHTMRWAVQGDVVTVDIKIDLRARVLFLPVYSYEHKSKETWRDGALVAIATTTNDDGDKTFVNGELKGAGFDVKSSKFNGVVPLPVAPTSYWAYSNLKKPTWINTQSGPALKVKVTPNGVESIKTRAGQIQARRYDVSGELDVSLWYDDKNRWVKSRFKAGDNVVTYVLQ
jgi:hypothetical protein